jgi:hydroxymethylpyrimidine pyrophosphatase-like HAD family hydrolase
VDLDGTLIHPEPEAIPVWGDSGAGYMSQNTAELLGKISRWFPVVIATGRNALSVGKLAEHIPEVRFSGFVLENGLIARTDLYGKIPLEEGWTEVCGMLPGWNRLKGYENCLGLEVPESEDDPGKTVREVLARTGRTAHLYQEPGKIFIFPFLASKLTGIRTLNFSPFVVLGNGTNDVDMLEAAAYPGTLSSAHERVRDKVLTRGRGHCSCLCSHAGTEDLLKWAADRIGAALNGLPDDGGL